jgi:hypothetical protein
MPLDEQPDNWFLAVHPLTLEELLENAQPGDRWVKLLEYSMKQAKFCLRNEFKISDVQIDKDMVDNGGSGKIQVAFELLISYFILTRYLSLNAQIKKLGKHETTLGTLTELRSEELKTWINSPKILYKKAEEAIKDFLPKTTTKTPRKYFDWSVEFEQYKRCYKRCY